MHISLSKTWRKTHRSNMMHSFFSSVQPLLLRGEASCIYPTVTNAQWSFFSACLDTPPFWKQETYPRQQPNNRLHSRGANKRERGQRGQEKPWQHLLRHTLGLSKFLPRPWHHNTTNYFVSTHSGNNVRTNFHLPGYINHNLSDYMRRIFLSFCLRRINYQYFRF